jgi:tetratricopeptide (TPR) repeat protein
MIRLWPIIALFLSSFILSAQEVEVVAEPWEVQESLSGEGQLEAADSLVLPTRQGYAEYRRALALREQFNYPAAVEALREAVQKDSLNTRWWSELADVYQLMGNAPDALATFRKAVALDPSHPPLKARMGRLLLSMQENREAYQVFSELRQADSLHLFYNRQLAVSASRLGKNREARERFRQVLELNPRDYGSTLALVTLLQQDTAFALARDYLVKSLALFPGNSVLELRTAQNDYYLKAYDRAAEGYELYLAHNDTALNVRKEYGVVLYFSKRETEALRILEPAIYLSPNDPMIPFYSGLCHKNLKNFGEAIRFMQTAGELAIPWTLPVIHRTLAQLYGQQREFRRAIEAYEKVLELDSSDSEVLFEIATTYEEFESDKTVAFQYYRRYVEMAGKGAPNEAYARNRMAKIKEALFFDSKGKNLILPEP